MKIFLDRCEQHIAVQRMLLEWRGMDIMWEEEPRDCDVQLSLVKIFTDSPLPKVLRLDGIYYDSATDYKARNKRISEAHSQADAVIYQSDYCMGMCERYLTSRKEGARGHVVYNGVKKNWCREHIDYKGVNIVVAARWRRHKRLKETIDLFLEYKKIDETARLHILGDLVENEPVKHKSIYYYGHLDYDLRMRAIFAIGDMSLHLSMKDCCPYSVVEAIGAGIPVITTTACGGAVELCGMTKNCHIVGELESPDPCSHYTDKYNYMNEETWGWLLSAMGLVGERKHRVKQPKELSIEYMATEYIRVMKSVM